MSRPTCTLNPANLKKKFYFYCYSIVESQMPKHFYCFLSLSLKKNSIKMGDYYTQVLDDTKTKTKILLLVKLNLINLLNKAFKK